MAVDPLRLSAFDPDDPLSPLKKLSNGRLGLQTQISIYFTLLDVITTCPAAEWEPGVGGSGRVALDAQYAAAMQCVVEAWQRDSRSPRRRR